jgi:polyisoprenoid-binding protein YceI
MERVAPRRWLAGTSLRRAYSALIFFAAVSVFSLAPALRAQDYTVHLDPAQTKVEFSLSASLHTVHGTFKLKSGEIHFDPASGKSTGEIVVDAASGGSDSPSRDKKMNQQVLESEKYPEIVFTAKEIHGSFDPKQSSQVSVVGVLRVHGQDHDFTMAFTTQPSSGSQLQCATKFSIPYVQWGMKDPSNFLLHVGDSVEIEIHASGQITAGATTH